MGENVLAMSTMVYPDEVVDSASIEELGAVEDVEVNSRELDIAKQLVDSLAGTFDADKYRDTYREEVLALVERKAEGKEIAVQPSAEEDEAEVPDLMSALKASLDAVKARDGDGGGQSKKKAAAKKAAKQPAGKTAAKS
jgi:DNA end-binding protein Ku